MSPSPFHPQSVLERQQEGVQRKRVQFGNTSSMIEGARACTHGWQGRTVLYAGTASEALMMTSIATASGFECLLDMTNLWVIWDSAKGEPAAINGRFTIGLTTDEVVAALAVLHSRAPQHDFDRIGQRADAPSRHLH